MPGCRPLTRPEENRLLRVVRTRSPRDRALITTEWFTGFRVSEILKLTLGHVWRDGVVLDKIGLAPRFMKGQRGRTRWVPITPELNRALALHVHHLGLRYDLVPDFPLFPSRERAGDGAVKPITRVMAHYIIKSAFVEADIEDDGRLATHTLRKTFAKRVYDNTEHDLMIVKSALGHADVQTTQRYIAPEESVVAAAIASCDFTRTRSPKLQAVPSGSASALKAV